MIAYTLSHHPMSVAYSKGRRKQYETGAAKKTENLKNSTNFIMNWCGNRHYSSAFLAWRLPHQDYSLLTAIVQQISEIIIHIWKEA